MKDGLVLVTESKSGFRRLINLRFVVGIREPGWDDVEATGCAIEFVNGLSLWITEDFDDIASELLS